MFWGTIIPSVNWTVRLSPSGSFYSSKLYYSSSWPLATSSIPLLTSIWWTFFTFWGDGAPSSSWCWVCDIDDTMSSALFLGMKDPLDAKSYLVPGMNWDGPLTDSNSWSYILSWWGYSSWNDITCILSLKGLNIFLGNW